MLGIDIESAIVAVIGVVGVLCVSWGIYHHLASNGKRWICKEIAEAVEAEMREHRPLLRHLGEVRNFKTDKSIMVRFERVEIAVDALPQGIKRISDLNETEHRELEASVATLVTRANKVESTVNRLRPEVAALNQRVFNIPIGRGGARVARQADVGDDSGSGSPGELHAPELPAPKPRGI